MKTNEEFFEEACETGNTDVATGLLDRVDKNKALISAHHHGHPEIVKKLLAAEGIDTNNENSCNEVYLLLNIHNMYTEIEKTLKKLMTNLENAGKR